MVCVKVQGVGTSMIFAASKEGTVHFCHINLSFLLSFHIFPHLCYSFDTNYIFILNSTNYVNMHLIVINSSEQSRT